MKWKVTPWLYCRRVLGIERPEFRLLLAFESGVEEVDRRITGSSVFDLDSWEEWLWSDSADGAVGAWLSSFILIPGAVSAELLGVGDDIKIRVTLGKKVLRAHPARGPIWFTGIFSFSEDVNGRDLWAARVCVGDPPREFLEAAQPLEMLG